MKQDEGTPSGGNLLVVGIGPGSPDHLTPAARAALERAEVVAGYRPYLDLVADLLEGKEILGSGMRQEVERCRQALERAAAGRTVALVSSGDAGVYGMAGLALELSPAYGVEVEVVPGVSAVQAAAALLGAPIGHDFAVISLSDLLTPWEIICRRLEAAAAADFIVALYNPRSRGRRRQLGEAREILLRHRPPSTPVGLVRNAGRDGERVLVSDLGSLPEEEVDMLTTVIVGSRSTVVDDRGKMVTPRGYRGLHRAAIPDFAARKEAPDKSRARALFVGGTGSDVGKSVVVAGLCRLLHRRGVKVAPFKAQNMALNSAVTADGLEIGRAQALQAAACGIEPTADMNPVLLKPHSEVGSQVILQGRPVGLMDVAEYHAFKPEAWKRVEASYRRLAAAHQVVILEGAGSVAEINLRRHDITNLRAAALADAPVLLVADIDRGGVFAALVGTVELLEPEERARLVGIVINKFRGDPALLTPGITEVERRTGVPVLGVVPWFDLDLPAEDSLALENRKKGGGALRIGVVRLPRISNFTDFEPLEREAGVALRYLDRPEQLAGLDAVFLPGTKNTLGDLAYLRERGWFDALRSYREGGGRLVGICGGYQMLGLRVADPHGVESPGLEAEGLGLLDVTTELAGDKLTHRAEGRPLPAACRTGLGGRETLTGYEIHMGRSRLGPGAEPLLRLVSRSGETVDFEDGAVSADGRVWGTYLHGLFDDDDLRRDWLASLGAESSQASPSYRLEAELDRWADHLTGHLRLEPLLQHLGLEEDR